MTQVPELEHHCGSWIVTDRTTGVAIYETWKRSVAEKINQDKYHVWTALGYLASLASNIKG